MLELNKMNEKTKRLVGTVEDGDNMINENLETKFLFDFSEEIWNQTYKYHTDNSVEDTHWRIANDLASVEKDPGYWAEQFYDALCGFKVVPGGRISSNAGTGLSGTSYINCVVEGPICEDKDSIGGIFNALTRAALTLKSECGYGFCADFIRPRGAFIHGVGVESPGAIEFLRLWDTMSDVITKGSGKKKNEIKGKNKIRKGAMMVTMSCWHPDIEEFIIAKSAAGKLTKFNMSVLCSNDFMEAVKNHLPWKLIYPDTTYQAYKKEWDGFLDSWLEKEYPVIVYKTFADANELWDLIMTNTYNRAEPGILFVDRMNYFNNLKYIEKVSATNPSLRYETKVLTKNGVYPIGYLAKQNENIVVKNINGEWQTAIAFKSGENKQLYKIVFSNNQEVYCTAEHKWPIINFEKNGEMIYSKKETPLIGKNDKIFFPHSKNPIDNKDCTHTSEDGFVLGWNLGDGWKTYHISSKVDQYGFVFGQEDVDYGIAERVLSYTNKLAERSSSLRRDHNTNAFTYVTTDKSVREKFSSLQSCHKRDGIPQSIWTGNSQFISGFIDGIFSSDGYVECKETLGNCRIILSTAHEKLAKDVRSLLSFYGIKSSIRLEKNKGSFPNKKYNNPNKEYSIYRLQINGMHVKKFADTFTLSNENKNQKLQRVCQIDSNSKTDKSYLLVKSVEPTQIFEDVYDITVFDDSHTFQVETGITGNCGEQILPVSSSCLLGSINLTQFINEDRTDWDFEKLKKYIPIFVRMLDNVNDKTKMPLKEQAEALQDKRRIGIGYLGYGSALYLMKVRYGSPQALKLTESLSNFVTNQCYQASVLLAKEKAPFQLYDENKYLASNFIKQALTKETIALIKKYGIRNSHLTSIQPTGNSSIYVNNVSSGLEPIVSAEYFRTSIVPVAPEDLEVKDIFLLDVEEQGIWKLAKEGDDSILITNFNGEVYKFDSNRGLTKETLIQDYAVKILKDDGSWDPKAEWAVDISTLSIRDHIETMKIFAKYIDSAMSKTVNIPNDYPYDDFKSIYMEFYDSGVIKGGTTYREGTMTHVVSAKPTIIADNQPSAITKHQAPKRPETLPCHVHQLTLGGEKWVVFVGLLGGQPYEVFAGLMENISLSKKITSGVLIKHARNKYGFIHEDVEIKDINSAFDNATQGALTRLTSMSLRHGVDIKFVINQLLKTGNGLNTFAKCLARTLKKYVEDGELFNDVTCEQCNSKNVAMVEGCHKCLSCGFSACQ